MSPDRIAETGEISDLNLALRESSKYPKKSTACQERCFSHVQGSTAPPIEVWIKPFQRFAGSQGSALSRIPQDAESPFETRGSARVSTNSRFKRRPQAARLFCAQSALIRPDPLDRVFFIVFLLPSTHFIRARHGSISALDNP